MVFHTTFHFERARVCSDHCPAAGANVYFCFVQGRPQGMRDHAITSLYFSPLLAAYEGARLVEPLSYCSTRGRCSLIERDGFVLGDDFFQPRIILEQALA